MMVWKMTSSRVVSSGSSRESSGVYFVFSSPQAPLATGVHVATMPWDFSQTMPLICCGVWHKPIYIYMYIYIYVCTCTTHHIKYPYVYIYIFKKYNHSIHNLYIRIYVYPYIYISMSLKYYFHFYVMYHIMNAKEFNTTSGGQIPRWICFFVLSMFNLACQMWLENWAPWKVNPFLSSISLRCFWRMKKKWNTVNKWTPNYVTIFFIFCTNAVWTQDVYPVNYSCGLENHPQMWKELLGPGFVGGFFETMVTSHKYKRIFCMWLFVTPPPILYYAIIINFDRTARWTCSIKMELETPRSGQKQMGNNSHNRCMCRVISPYF